MLELGPTALRLSGVACDPAPAWSEYGYHLPCGPQLEAACRRPYASGMLDPMFSLAHCRHFMARRSWLRGAWVLLALAVVMAGLPRWELHAHGAAEYGHTHGDVHAAHDEPAPPASDQDAAVPHVHEAAVTAAAPLAIDALRVAAAPTVRIAIPRNTGQVASAVWPPPQRPPIV